jgi:hypothetical protein
MLTSFVWAEGLQERTVVAKNKTPYVLIVAVGDKTETLEPAASREFEVTRFWDARITLDAKNGPYAGLSFLLTGGGDINITVDDLNAVMTFLYGNISIHSK